MTELDALRCSAVLVTYAPDLHVLDRVVQAIVPQVEQVTVVHNGSVDELGVRPWSDRVEVLALGRNFGIAYAQNRGLEAAMNRGSHHVLLMDQDSIPGPDMVERLAATLKAAEEDGARVAAAGPRYLDPRSGNESFFLALGGWRFRKLTCCANSTQKHVYADWLISSGTMIRSDALREIGFMSESLFIDDVDTEWCLRARSKGYAVVGACEVVMNHTLGARTVRVKLNREHDVPVHSPVRLYYMIRNHFLLMRLPHVPWRWWVPNSKRLVFMFFLFSFLIPPRWENSRMMLRGVWDGLRNRSGPYSRRG